MYTLSSAGVPTVAADGAHCLLQRSTPTHTSSAVASHSFSSFHLHSVYTTSNSPSLSLSLARSLFQPLPTARPSPCCSTSSKLSSGGIPDDHKPVAASISSSITSFWRMACPQFTFIFLWLFKRIQNLLLVVWHRKLWKIECTAIIIFKNKMQMPLTDINAT